MILRSKLATFGRPTVMFDADDPQHRQWLSEFLATRAWGHCPVRFVVSEEGDMVTVMQRQVLHYYSEQEFGFSLPKAIDKALA